MSDENFPSTIYVTLSDEADEQFRITHLNIDDIAVPGQQIPVAIYKRVEIGVVTANPLYTKQV